MLSSVICLLIVSRSSSGLNQDQMTKCSLCLTVLTQIRHLTHSLWWYLSKWSSSWCTLGNSSPHSAHWWAGVKRTTSGSRVKDTDFLETVESALDSNETFSENRLLFIHFRINLVTSVTCRDFVIFSEWGKAVWIIHINYNQDMMLHPASKLNWENQR